MLTRSLCPVGTGSAAIQHGSPAGAIIGVRAWQHISHSRSHIHLMPQGKRLDPAVLQAALEGLEFQRQRLNQQIAQVKAMLRPAPKKRAATAREPAKPRRRLSLAARKRIAAAQRKRWAALKKAKEESAPKKRRLSAEGRRHIIEATRKRWAEFRAKKAAKEAKAAAKKARKPAVTKPTKPSVQPAAE